MLLLTCKPKMWSDTIDSLSNRKFDKGDDGYMFEPTRSEGDTAGHVHRAGDSEKAGVLVV